MKTKFKMPEVGDHILLKSKIFPPIEATIVSLGDDEFCAIVTKTGEGINVKNELICCSSVPELLAELQKYREIYLMED